MPSQRWVRIVDLRNQTTMGSSAAAVGAVCDRAVTDRAYNFTRSPRVLWPGPAHFQAM